MRRPGATTIWVRVALGLVGLSLVLTALSLVFLALNLSTPLPDGEEASDEALFALVFLPFSAVGALIATRQTGNAIGWILIAAGGAFAISGFAQGYAIYALFTNPGSLPAGQALGWLWSWTPYVGLGITAAFLLLLFPDGRLPSRRWRPVAWLAAGSLVVLFLGSFSPGPLGGFDDITSIENPFGHRPRRGVPRLARRLHRLDAARR